MNVEGAAKGDERVNELWIPEGEIGGMVATEAAAGDGDAGGIIALADKRQYFFEQVAFIGHVAFDAGAGRDGLVVPAFGIDAVNTESLQLAAFVAVADDTDHVAIFVVVEAA